MRGFIKGSPTALEAGRKAKETRENNKKKKLSKYNAPGKNAFRDLLVKTMYENNCAYGNIVSLETSAYLFNKSIPAHHIHFQHDADEYKLMTANMPDDTEVILGDITKSTELHQHVDAVWLDFMVSYDSVCSKIEEIVSSNPYKNCKVFGITVSPRTTSRDKKIPVQTERVLSHLDRYFEDYERFPIYSYKDTAPMWGIILSLDNSNLYYESEDIYKRILEPDDFDFTCYYPKSGYPNVLESHNFCDKYLDNYSGSRERLKIRYDSLPKDTRHTEYIKDRCTFDFVNGEILNAFTNEPKTLNELSDDATISKARVANFISLYNDILIEGCTDNFKYTPNYKRYIKKDNDIDILDIFGWKFFDSINKWSPQYDEIYEIIKEIRAPTAVTA